MAMRQTTELEICVFMCCLVIGIMVWCSSYWVVKEELGLLKKCSSGNCGKITNFFVLNETFNNADEAFKVSLEVLKDWFNSNASNHPAMEHIDK